MRRLRPLRPTPSMVVACIALFVALGGVGYAAKTGAISSREIRDGTIRSADVHAGALTGADIRNGRIGTRDVRDNGLTGRDLVESSLGKVPVAGRADRATASQTASQAARSQTAASVDPGAVTATALRARSVTATKLTSTTVRSQATTIDPGETALVTATCAAGQQRLSGGAFWTASPLGGPLASQLRIVHAFPSVTADGWSARGYNGSTAPQTFEARVLCLGAR